MIGRDQSGPETATATATAAPAAVDRAEVREILEAAGAPAKDLDRLVASCSSIEDARGYRAPAERDAWCANCDGARGCNEQGCIACGGGR